MWRVHTYQEANRLMENIEKKKITLLQLFEHKCTHNVYSNKYVCFLHTYTMLKDVQNSKRIGTLM